MQPVFSAGFLAFYFLFFMFVSLMVICVIIQGHMCQLWSFMDIYEEGRGGRLRERVKYVFLGL
jgi:hypothetical protein